MLKQIATASFEKLKVEIKVAISAGSKVALAIDVWTERNQESHGIKVSLDLGSSSGSSRMAFLAPASEAICERLFKQAKHIGTINRKARLRDETFEILVMAQYNLARHGGLEATEVSMISISFL